VLWVDCDVKLFIHLLMFRTVETVQWLLKSARHVAYPSASKSRSRLRLWNRGLHLLEVMSGRCRLLSLTEWLINVICLHTCNMALCCLITGSFCQVTATHRLTILSHPVLCRFWCTAYLATTSKWAVTW